MANQNLNLSKEIGYKIKFVRNMRKISLINLAEKLGISRQQLQKYEAGAIDIKIDILYNIAKIMNVDIAYFFESSQYRANILDDEMSDILLNVSAIKDIKIREALCALVGELAKN